VRRKLFTAAGGANHSAQKKKNKKNRCLVVDLGALFFILSLNSPQLSIKFLSSTSFNPMLLLTSLTHSQLKFQRGLVKNQTCLKFWKNSCICAKIISDAV
jgi:hypothetical protein